MKAVRVMEQIYGKTKADEVANYLTYLDPELRDIVEDVAYNFFWSLPGLSMKEKSLVTVSALIAQKKEQLSIHLYGFLNLGASYEEIMQIILHIQKHYSNLSCESAFLAFNQIFEEREGKKLDSSDFNSLNLLPPKDRLLINLAVSVALNNPLLLQAAVSECAENDMTHIIKHVFIHLTVYCGFPSIMKAFADMHQVLEKLK